MAKRRIFLGLTTIISCSTAVVLAAEPAVRQDRSFDFSVDGNEVQICSGEKVLLRYQYGKAQPKAYIKELFTPSGLNVLLDSPPDHVHHHALMFACAVDGVDFWSDPVPQAADRTKDNVAAGPGRQEHQRFPLIGANDTGRRVWVGLEEDLRWIGPRGGGPLLVEYRRIRLDRSFAAKATLLTWECELAVPAGKESVTLTGSHYHGLGMRFIRSMDTDGEFRNPDNDPGVVFRGEERLTRSRWCAYTAQADGRTVTVAMFDLPANARHPATWFTMAKPFAYMSATLRLHEEPLKVPADRPLSLRYGVALWDGRIETPQIDTLYKQWVSIETKSVR